MRRDWILLAIHYVDGVRLSPVQLQKSLFLLGEKKPSAVGGGFYNFVPYNYGPFCRDIYSDTESLALEGLITFGSYAGQGWKGYSLTDEGREHVEALMGKARPEDLKYFSEVVQWVRKLSFKQLLSAIYEAYPGFKTKSVFAEW